jgi:hypothetical protein
MEVDPPCTAELVEEQMILAAQDDVFENPRFHGVTSQEVGEGALADSDSKLGSADRLARPRTRI